MLKNAKSIHLESVKINWNFFYFLLWEKKVKNAKSIQLESVSTLKNSPLNHEKIFDKNLQKNARARCSKLIEFQDGTLSPGEKST